MINKGTKMDSDAARRIQSSQDKKGQNGDAGFKSRSMSSSARSAKK
jgi:hypothetical protein